jgi:hypothetical protein
VTIPLAAVNLVTALVRPVLPDTVVRPGTNITRNLYKLDYHARVLVRGRKDRSDDGRRTGRTDAGVVAAQAVLAAGPLGQRELARLRVVCGLGDVLAVRRVVEPVTRG